MLTPDLIYSIMEMCDVIVVNEQTRDVDPSAKWGCLASSLTVMGS